MADEHTDPTWVDLLRHGQPEGGQRYRGHLDDPLSELGFAQMAAALDPEEHWDAIITSSLRRCRAFAEQLADQRGLPLHVEPGFMEVDFGEWEGLTAEEILARDGDRLAAFWADSVRHPPPGGEHINDFAQRVGRAWDHWTARLQGQRILLICHGGVIRMAVAHALKLPPKAMMAGLSVPYASRTSIRLDHTDYGRLSCLVHHGGDQ
ncbi:MAG: histidine phosphatase family protein [Aquisalimonadaceae bacterium]